MSNRELRTELKACRKVVYAIAFAPDAVLMKANEGHCTAKIWRGIARYTLKVDLGYDLNWCKEFEERKRDLQIS